MLTPQSRDRKLLGGEGKTLLTTMDSSHLYAYRISGKKSSKYTPFSLRSTVVVKLMLNVYLQDEIDKVMIWNTPQIRSRPDHGVQTGHPILMHSMPQLYAAEDKLQCALREEVAACREECTLRGQYPGDKTLFELCVLRWKMFGVLLQMHTVLQNCIHY